jgi:hypothetical protein
MLAPGLTDGHSYIVFTSYDRGGTCVSALFRYDPRTEVAAFLYDRDGYEAGRILLAGRTLTVPATATLAGLRRHLDPTGGVIYPSDVSESLCPGP